MNFQEISDWIRQLLREAHFSNKDQAIAHLLIGLVALFLLCFVFWAVSRFIIIRYVKRIVRKSTSKWDDQLYKFRVFRGIAFIIISITIVKAVPVLFSDFPNWKEALLIVSKVYVVLSIMFAINSLLNALLAILEGVDKLKDKPLRSYKQVAKIVFYMVGFVMILAIIFDQSPVYILGGFGAVTAVLLLIFKDPILGFVASIQMSAIDLVRIGDWISVDKYGADGEVVEINLTTIKVQNWDMTITIVPSYAIVSESFKNYRGMQESDGRRVKRHLNIKISSIKFVDEKLYNKLLHVERISQFLKERKKEIDDYNTNNAVDKSVLINGRHMTNIGVFREYAETYLKQNPNINTEMTVIVRQLLATEHGIPLEVYAFSKFKDFDNFEKNAADIFDHLLAAVPFFELEIFQSPSGSDMNMIGVNRVIE
jgi:miniconductance mechanosensitive channel